MRAETITAEIRFAWWLRPYLSVLGFFADLMGAEPDWDKLDRIISRSVRIREVV